MNSFYARLDKENKVTNVIEVSVEDEKPKGLNKLLFWKDKEYWGIKFCQNLVNDSESVILYPCHGSKGNQFWEYEDEVCLII